MAENEEFKIKGAARAVAVKHIEVCPRSRTCEPSNMGADSEPPFTNFALLITFIEKNSTTAIDGDAQRSQSMILLTPTRPKD